MNIDQISWKTNLERATEIRVLEFADQVYIYERREVTQPINGGVPERPVTTFEQGVVGSASVEAVKLGLFEEIVPFDPTLGEKAGADYVPMMISDKGLETIRVEGHPFSHHEVFVKLTQSGDLVRKNEASFIDLFEKNFTAKNVFFVSVKDHSIVDLNGVPIVVPFRFSYLEGLSSESYDLDRVLEVVAENPEVEIGRDRWGSEKTAIPNYDDEDAPRRYSLWLNWRPTADSWGKLLANAEERGMGSKFVSFRAYDLLTTHDVLGLTAAGCRLDLERETSDLKL
jgi:hypothetical protein